MATKRSKTRKRAPIARWWYENEKHGFKLPASPETRRLQKLEEAEWKRMEGDDKHRNAKDHRRIKHELPAMAEMLERYSMGDTDLIGASVEEVARAAQAAEDFLGNVRRPCVRELLGH